MDQESGVPHTCRDNLHIMEKTVMSKGHSKATNKRERERVSNDTTYIATLCMDTNRQR